MLDVTDEVWEVIPDFPDYQVSTLGRIYSTRRDVIMQPSKSTIQGHLKISLSCDDRRGRLTRSVAQLVGEAFVEADHFSCDHIVLLDGNTSNVRATNLVWRPKFYAWQYSRQLHVEQPDYYYTFPVIELGSEKKYPCVIDAGMREGLLFADIWRSTQTQAIIFPNARLFQIV